jgi:UDP-N-acetylmuramyl pentapeptide phosphotransferase/UDP-N-acetylglucosamine-1-phosphate transferase
MDLPNERSLHHIPTPRTGGLAIMGSMLIGLVVVGVMGAWPLHQGEMGSIDWPTLFWITGLTIFLAMISFLDDRTGLPIAIRFGAHTVAAGMVILGARLSLPPVELPPVGTLELGWLAPVVSIIFLIWMTNLYNFMDGMDGFAGGMTVFGAGFLASFAWLGQHRLIFSLSLLIAFAAFGFLAHNFPPARIFMGDVGSVPTGFLMGALILLGCRDHLFTPWVPMMLFSPFIVDATVTLIRRVMLGERVWVAHRMHFYQRLVLLGWGHRKTVLAEYGLMGLCGILAWSYQLADETARLSILCIWAVLMLSGMLGIHAAERMSAQMSTNG